MQVCMGGALKRNCGVDLPPVYKGLLSRDNLYAIVPVFHQYLMNTQDGVESS